MSQPDPELDRQVLERIELALPEWSVGGDVLERNLELDGRQVAHWLLNCPGRLLLVSVVDGASDGAVLRAMDGLAFIHNQPEMLGALLGDLNLEEIQVGIVLVALEDYSKVQLERLATLPSMEIELLRRRELRSQRGTHTRLEAVVYADGLPSDPPVELPDWSLDESFRPFLARIAPDSLQLALNLIERIRRMDPQFGWCMQGPDLGCQFNGSSLARLQWEGSSLSLLFNEGRPAVQIRDSLGLELALEELLDVYLDVLSGGRSRESHQALEAEPAAMEWELPTRVDEPELADGFHEPRAHMRTTEHTFDMLEALGVPAESEPESVDELEELDDVEILPLPPGPLLTRDEIEAFLE